MIRSKEDYIQYLEADKRALNITQKSVKQWFIELFFPHEIWEFQKLLRKVEYLHNCSDNPVNRAIFPYYLYKFRKKSIKLGFSIPRNVFGPGLAIVHYGTIVVNARAKVGKNCRIHACTNIGASGGKLEAPQIGDNVYIGPGAKIFGDIQLANGIVIGANATVNRSFLEESILIAGCPAKKIKDIDVSELIKHIRKKDDELPV